MHRIVFVLVLILCNPVFASEQIGDIWRQAVQMNRINTIRQYLHIIEDVDQPANNGKTALMAAAFKGADDVAGLLIARGANVNQHNHLLGSPLMYAAGSGDTATVSLLLHHGAAINHQSANGWNALMIAVAKNHRILVDLLCRMGANVNDTDIYGWTPLMRAAFEGRHTIVEALLEHPEIDIERINDHGQSALHLAVAGNQTRTVALLLLKGALQKDDFSGNTPLSIAKTLNDNRLIDQLQTQKLSGKQEP